MRGPSWEDNVVCSQPARNLSRPDGLEDPEDSREDENVPIPPDPANQHLRGHGAGFALIPALMFTRSAPL